MHLAILASIAISGQAFAADDCAAASAKFESIVPIGPMQTVDGKTAAETLLDVDNRWFLVAPAYIGALSVFQNSTDRAVRVDAAVNLISLDVLVNCWRPAKDAGSANQQKAVSHFFELFSPEFRLDIRNKAEALQ